MAAGGAAVAAWLLPGEPQAPEPLPAASAHSAWHDEARGPRKELTLRAEHVLDRVAHAGGIIVHHKLEALGADQLDTLLLGPRHPAAGAAADSCRAGWGLRLCCRERVIGAAAVAEALWPAALKSPWPAPRCR